MPAAALTVVVFAILGKGSQVTGVVLLMCEFARAQI